MDHAATVQRLYDLITATVVDQLTMMRQLGQIPATPSI